MKYLKLLLIAVVLLVNTMLSAQETKKEKSDSVYYNGFVNIVPDHYNKLLYGQFNFAKGSHEGAQIGIINWNQNNFGGDHLQLGAIINIVGGAIDNGTQIGAINVCMDSITGEQIGLLNFAKKRKGLQLGIVNYCDTMESGFSLGFISLVKKGFQAIDIGVTEMYPINISYKVGYKYLYNSLDLSLNYKNNINNTMNGPVFGFGFGSLIPLGKSFNLNPDFLWEDKILKSQQHIISLVTKLCYEVNKKFYVAAGPSLVFAWVQVDTDPSQLHKPMYSLYHSPIDETNIHRQRNYIGFRFSVSYVIRGT